MAQFNWLYLGENGRKYNVGLFHGARTGHLMVTCNARIVLIDFSVQQSKEYSFFIDDELFELSIDRQPTMFSYNCSINEVADTPRNRIRKKRKKIDFRKTVALISIFAVVVIVALGFAVVANQDPPPIDEQAMLRQKGLETHARVFVERTPSGQPSSLRYTFIADGRVREFYKSLTTEKVNGFPMQNGDEFRLRYVYDRPGVHQLDLDKPTSRQLEKYLVRTVRQHHELNPKLTRLQAECQANVAFRLGGVDALAVLFNQHTPQESDAVFNELAFKRFTRDIPFQEAVERECWQ